MKDELEINAALQIQRPAAEVFDAIVDPEKMKNYFISESTGRMEEGNELTWKFPEFDAEVPVRINQVKRGQFISFSWDTNFELLVEMDLKSMPDDSTVVSIVEKSKPIDDAGIKWLQGNTEGWANFLACLKAYLEYNINLRKGAFDFRKGEF